MTFALGVLSGFVGGICFSILAGVGLWAAWLHKDQLIWGRVRAAEKAAPLHSAVILTIHNGLRP